MTFEQYIEDHSSSAMRSYLTGYTDAIHNNAYFFGGCPKRFQYRPYNEYMQHIDIYIAQKTKDDVTNREIFLQKSIEPFLTEVVLKYIDCDNPEAIQLQDQPKPIQIEIRDVSRDVMQKTNKYQTIDEREMEFQYNEYLKRLKNPTKAEKASKILHSTGGKKQKNISKPISEKLKEQAEKEAIERTQNEEKDDGVIDSMKDSIKDIANGVISKFSSKKEEKVEIQPEKTLDIGTRISRNIKSESEAQPAKSEPVNPTPKPQPSPEKTAPKAQDTPKDSTKSNKQNIDLSVPELEISKSVSGKPTAPLSAPKTEYKLDAMDINLDTLNNAKLPSI